MIIKPEWRNLRTGILIIYGFLLFAVTFWLWSFDSGLPGWIAQVQMEVLGSEDRNGTFLCLMFIVFVIGFLPLAILEKFAPTLYEQMFPPPWAEAPKNPQPISLSWKFILIATVVPAVIGPACSGFWWLSRQSETKQIVSQIDLASGFIRAPDGAKFVEVTGLLLRERALALKKTENHSVSHEVFAPIVTKNWQPTDPVNYFVRYKSSEQYGGSYDGSINLPAAFHQRGMATFSGKLGSSLPTYIENKFSSDGIKFGDPLFVIEWKELPDHKIPGPSTEDIAIPIGISIGLSLMLLLSLSLSKFMTEVNSRKLNLR